MQDVSYIVLDKEKDEVEKMAVDVFRKVKLMPSVQSLWSGGTERDLNQEFQKKAFRIRLEKLGLSEIE